MEFEWNSDKASRNIKKHGVSFNEAASVFADPLGMDFPDPQHSLGESRYVMIGLSEWGRLLVVAHTERGDRIRIISARRATSQEQRFYEEGN
jgi:uncharacterized DUF497 family protein